MMTGSILLDLKVRMWIPDPSLSNLGTLTKLYILSSLSFFFSKMDLLIVGTAGVPVVTQWKRIRLGTIRLRVRSLTLLSGLRIRRCCELWCRSKSGSDLVLLWLWCGPAAVAPIGPLAWEYPYTMGAAPRRKKRKKIIHIPIKYTWDIYKTAKIDY